jgi:hydrogenase large subunit
MATPLDIDSDNAINAERLMHVSQLIDQARDFVNQVYIPDLLAIGSYYKDWTYGGGLNNYLCYGDFSTGSVYDYKNYRMPRGIILNGNLNEVLDVDLKDPNQVKEFIDHSWYTYDGKQGGGKHPFEGETTFHYTGPKAPFKQLDTNKEYSWLKAPRWKDHPMETGPLARMMVGYASGKDEIVNIVNDTLKKLNLPMSALQSALGRTVARGIESVLISGWLRNDMDDLLKNIKNGDQVTFDRTKWEPSTWPKSAKGVGWMEAPRGALGHWIDIENGKTKNYQAVVPTTWNASPRDHKNNIGAYEAALKGTPMLNKEQPLEILRIIHSFDPCLACAVHLTDLETKNTTEIRLG